MQMTFPKQKQYKLTSMQYSLSVHNHNYRCIYKPYKYSYNNILFMYRVYVTIIICFINFIG